MSKITTFYSDKEKTNALYPITKTNAIYDNNNVNLEQRLNEALKLQMDLLWTNASPTSEFVPQTVSLDLSKYKAVLIRVKKEYNQAYYSDNLLYKNSGIMRIAMFDIESNIRTGVQISDSGITFGVGIFNGSTNNSSCIPYQIYGVR